MFCHLKIGSNKDIFIKGFWHRDNKNDAESHFKKYDLSVKLYVGQDFVILACVVSSQCQSVMDGRTDRQTDNPTVGNTGLCVASYVDAL